MNNQNSFIMYIDYDKHFEYLSKEELADLMLAIWRWQRSGEEPNGLTAATMIAFSFIKQDMERNNEKWLKEKEAKSIAGKKGMQKRWNGEKEITNDNKIYQNITDNNRVITDDNKNNIYVNVNVNDNVNDSVNVNKEKINKKKFGKFLNVCLSDEEYKNLISEFGVKEANANIEALSTYMESKGKTYKNHYATLINFINRNQNDVKKYKQDSKSDDFLERYENLAEIIELNVKE